MNEVSRIVRVIKPEGLYENIYDWMIHRKQGRTLRGHAVHRDTQEVIPNVVRFLDSKNIEIISL